MAAPWQFDGGFVNAQCEGRGETRGACAASIIRFVTAQDRLRELSDFAAPWAVWIAATLRLPDHIEAGAARLEDLSDRTRTDPDALMRLLRYLVARGVFAEAAGRYENTELSRLLLDEGGWRQWLDLDGAPGVWANSSGPDCSTASGQARPAATRAGSTTSSLVRGAARRSTR
jgi:hypothetical protein